MDSRGNIEVIRCERTRNGCMWSFVANWVEDDTLCQDPVYMQAGERTEKVRASLPGPPPEHSFRIINILHSKEIVTELLIQESMAKVHPK